jgi:hypothetical protein
MRKITWFLPVMAMLLLALLMGNRNGSVGRYSGSPGDNGSSCLSCHSGSGNNASGWITTNIPESGYHPGEVYTITLNATDANAVRFGFELTAEDGFNTKIPNFTITNTTETKLTNGGNAVTHTNAGTDPAGNTKTWSFNWVAPELGTGTVTFYAAVNAANGNGFSSGDVIYKTNTAITESSTGLEEISGLFIFYPNPTTGLIYFEGKSLSGERELVVLNNQGQEVERLIVMDGTRWVDFSHLARGWYVIRVTDGRKTSAHKILLY